MKFLRSIICLFCASWILLGAQNICHALDFSLAKNSIQSLYDFSFGLGSQGVNDITQTADGYIWVATYSGLFRYDGKEFLKIDANVDEDFTSTSINKLYLAKDGTLYIGSNDRGLFKYVNGDFSLVKYYSNVLSTSIRYINEDNKGTIYVSTAYGMGKIQNGVLQSAGRAGLYIISVQQFTFDEHNRLWGVVNDGSVVIAEKDNIIYTWNLNWQHTENSAFSLSDALMAKGKERYNYTARSITRLMDGSILFGTNEGYVFKVKYDVDEPKILSRSYDMLLTHANGFYEDVLARIWAFSDLGIGYFNADMEFTGLGGLKSDIFIRSMYQDHERNFWFASLRDGLLHLTKSYFSEEMFPKSKNTFVSSTAIWNGDLFIGTDQGISLANGRKSEAITNYFDGIRIRGLMVSSKNSLWVATNSAYNRGIVEITDKLQFKRFTEDNGLSSGFIQSVYEKRDGTIWVGTQHGLNVIKNDVVMVDYFDDNTLLTQSILSMIEIESGDMLIGTDGSGLFQVSNGKIVKKITGSDGLNSNIILRMAQDPISGIVYISTGSNILNSYHPLTGKIEKITNFVADGNIHDIKLVDGELIILSENVIYKTTPQDLARGNIESFGYGKGLRTPISALSWNAVDRNNKLYICAENNVYSTNFEKHLTNNLPSYSAITSVDIDSKKYYKDFEKIVLKPSDVRIIFNFAYLSFEYSESSSISYMLEGFDTDYKTLSYQDDYSASYTNLPYGNYIFKVKGQNSLNSANFNEIRIPLEVRPYWYETTETKVMFVTMLVVFVAVVTGLIYRRRMAIVLEKHNFLRAITRQFMLSFSKIIDAKDTYTNGHSARVAYYSIKIMQELDFPEKDLETLYYAALLHDVGKVGISDNILTKSSRLEEEEYAVIQEHAVIGANILKDITLVENIGIGAKFHHERYDGTGYPKGLKGDEIPLLARIIGVTDSFDAMTSGRRYKTNTIEWGIEELKKCSGTLYDPQIVEIFVNLVESGAINVYDGTTGIEKFNIDFN